MPLLLNNKDVHQLLNMEECVRALEEVVTEWAQGDAEAIPRVNFFAPGERPNHYFALGSMSGGSKKWQMYCMRLLDDMLYYERRGDILTREKYCIEPGTYCGLLLLFSTKNGEPLAIIHDGIIQHMRVAGETAVAVNMVANKDAATMGMLGSGGMARSFAEAMKAVRPIRKIKVYSPTQTHRDLYAREMSEKLGIEVTPVSEAREAVQGANIVCTCTDSLRAVMLKDWLEPGMLVCGVGREEVDDDLIDRCDLRVTITTDTLVSTEGRGRNMVGYAYFAGSDEDFAGIPKEGRPAGYRAEKYTRLLDIISGKAVGRQREDEIIHVHGGGFNSVGFVALAGLAYTKATKLGMGRRLPLDWFTQDIRD